MMSPGYHPKRSHRYSHALVTNVLRLLWVVLVITGELGAFFWSLSGCRWPLIGSGHQTRQVSTTHVLLVADAQVQHPSLLSKGSWWANPIRRLMFELNLRKSWHVTSRLRPDVVIFLGDMLANGKSARSFEEYEQAVHKFKSIFSIDPGTVVYYVPGNNDVGLGSVSTISRKLRTFYKESFGPVNQDFQIANHTFVILDAPGLVDEDYQRHAKYVTFEDWKPIPDGPVAFIKDVAEYIPSNLVLLSHIPLSRPETANCGPLRERGTIRRGAGPGYQSMLGKQTTNFLLRNLQPLVVFSADNRDYCDYNHMVPGDNTLENTIREVTVKSFAMSVHIRRPGFQLLSLADPSKVDSGLPSLVDRPCLLPDQYGIYTSHYAFSMCITLLILFLLNIRGTRGRALRKPEHLSLSPSLRSSGRNSPNSILLQAERTPWTGTWTPLTPSQPASPRAALPSYIRTPHTPAGSTTMLVASRPGTPVPPSPSSFIASREYHDMNDEDDDTMYPAQYAGRRDAQSHIMHRQRDEDDWLHVGSQEDLEGQPAQEAHDGATDQETIATSPRVQSQFISAPGQGGHSKIRDGWWSWTYIFVFGGRSRRLVLRLPRWNSVINLLDLFGFGGPPARGGMTLALPPKTRKGDLVLTVMDTMSVLWPATVAYLIINWTVL